MYKKGNIITHLRCNNNNSNMNAVSIIYINKHNIMLLLHVNIPQPCLFIHSNRYIQIP